MEILGALCAAVAFALVFRAPLSKHPAAFYLLAIVLDAAFLSGALASVAPDVHRMLLPYLRRCIAPYALLTVVMFVGVLPGASPVRSRLAPIRGPLSVIAALLALCHAASFVQAYASEALSGFSTAAKSTVASLVLAVAVTLVLALLAATSLNAIRKRMRSGTWQRVQRWAYVFYALMSLHAILLLLPSGLSGARSGLTVAVYGGVFGLYVALRCARSCADASLKSPSSGGVGRRIRKRGLDMRT